VGPVRFHTSNAADVERRSDVVDVEPHHPIAERALLERAVLEEGILANFGSVQIGHERIV
jgi:hypothetical protein